jgi:cytochrome P450
MMAFGFMLMPTRFFEQCQERCGDYFTLRPAPDRILVMTSDPQAVKEVFTGDPDLLHAGAGNEVLAPILGSGSVLLLDGAEHLRHRRMLLPPFHGERMRSYGELMREVAERHIAAWPASGRFPVLESMQAITLEIIMRAVFGLDDGARMERVGRPLRKMLDTVASRRRVLMLALSAEHPAVSRAWARFTAARAEADALLGEEIAARRANPTHGEDVLSLLLAAEDEDGNGLTDKELRDELMTLLVAGHETTATALSWTLERLTRHPQVLAQAERDRDPAYLDAVIKETLRLRPVVPSVVRRLQAPHTFGPWELPAGVHIAPSIYLLHRRPDLYPDPTAFRPERFLGRAPGTYEWIPFGGGTRRCLGASFALFEMQTVLDAVLRTRRLIPTPARRGEKVTRRAITFAPSRQGRIAAAPRL